MKLIIRSQNDLLTAKAILDSFDQCIHIIYDTDEINIKNPIYIYFRNGIWESTRIRSKGHDNISFSNLYDKLETKDIGCCKLTKESKVVVEFKNSEELGFLLNWSGYDLKTPTEELFEKIIVVQGRKNDFYMALDKGTFSFCTLEYWQKRNYSAMSFEDFKKRI